jgi:hypothetical protein
MRTDTFANGQQLTTTALLDSEFAGLLQDVVLSVLNISPTDADAYSKVRVAWKVPPAWDISEDICSIQVSEIDGDYNRVRDRRYLAQSALTTILQIDKYTRIWQASFIFYGPSSGDHARLLRSSMKLDFTHDALLASNVVLTGKVGAATRAPELFEGQWWERSDVRLEFYELITETLSVPTIASTEILLYNSKGLQADIEITA